MATRHLSGPVASRPRSSAGLRGRICRERGPGAPCEPFAIHVGCARGDDLRCRGLLQALEIGLAGRDRTPPPHVAARFRCVPASAVEPGMRAYHVRAVGLQFNTGSEGE